jgi:hypothetical protein
MSGALPLLPYMPSWLGKRRASWFRHTSISVILRRMFGPKRDEVTGEWRRIHYEELHDQYYLEICIFYSTFCKHHASKPHRNLLYFSTFLLIFEHIHRFQIWNFCYKRE